MCAHLLRFGRDQARHVRVYKLHICLCVGFCRVNAFHHDNIEFECAIGPVPETLVGMCIEVVFIVVLDGHYTANSFYWYRTHLPPTRDSKTKSISRIPHNFPRGRYRLFSLCGDQFRLFSSDNDGRLIVRFYGRWSAGTDG